jgi:hypothetical protein
MKAPRKDRGKRLQEAKQREAKRAVDDAIFAASPAGRTILGEALVMKFDPENRGEDADAALTLHRGDKMLIRAFTEFKLDSRNPYHWKLLATYLAESLYGEPGRPKKWTAANARDLVDAVDQLITADRNPKAVERAIAKLNKTKRYRMVTFETLKRSYYKAKKPRLVRK